MSEKKQNNVHGLKSELDKRKKVLDDVINKMKEDKDDTSEKKLRIIKNIEKNRDVMEHISKLLDKNRENEKE